MVLVHGTPWSSYSFHKLLPVLSNHFQIYVYDLIGYGQSEMKDSQIVSLDMQGEIFKALLDHWGLKCPNVIAHDFGGAISLRAHLLHGVDYNKYLLMNVVAMAPWGSPFFAHVRAHEAAFSEVPDYIHRAILAAYIEGAMFQKAGAEDMAALMHPWLSPEGQKAFYRQIAQADQKYTDEVEPDYSNIRCPVRILWGEKDEWIPIETGRKLHKAITHSEFVSVPKAGHLVQMEQPGIVQKNILEFFS